MTQNQDEKLVGLDFDIIFIREDAEELQFLSIFCKYWRTCALKVKITAVPKEKEDFCVNFYNGYKDYM